MNITRDLFTVFTVHPKTDLNPQVMVLFFTDCSFSMFKCSSAFIVFVYRMILTILQVEIVGQNKIFKLISECWPFSKEDSKTVHFLIAGMVPYCHFTFNLLVSLKSTLLA